MLTFLLQWAHPGPIDQRQASPAVRFGSIGLDWLLHTYVDVRTIRTFKARPSPATTPSVPPAMSDPQKAKAEKKSAIRATGISRCSRSFTKHIAYMHESLLVLIPKRDTRYMYHFYYRINCCYNVVFPLLLPRRSPWNQDLRRGNNNITYHDIPFFICKHAVLVNIYGYRETHIDIKIHIKTVPGLCTGSNFVEELFNCGRRVE